MLASWLFLLLLLFHCFHLFLWIFKLQAGEKGEKNKSGKEEGCWQTFRNVLFVIYSVHPLARCSRCLCWAISWISSIQTRIKRDDSGLWRWTFCPAHHQFIPNSWRITWLFWKDDITALRSLRIYSGLNCLLRQNALKLSTSSYFSGRSRHEASNLLPVSVQFMGEVRDTAIGLPVL